MVAEFKDWLALQLPKVPGKSDLAKAIRYGLSRWHAFTLFLDDATVAIDNNAAERAIRPLSIGRKNWLFAGSDRGAENAATIMTLIETALCRARHKAVYAEGRTMPSGSVFGSARLDLSVFDSA